MPYEPSEIVERYAAGATSYATRSSGRRRSGSSTAWSATRSTDRSWAQPRMMTMRREVGRARLAALLRCANSDRARLASTS